MALSREEASNIGKEAADKVIKSARGCRCGVAMWDARTNIASLEAVINFKRSDWLLPLPQFMESILISIEDECGIDVSQPKELSKRLQGDIKQRDWPQARVNLALLQGSILGPLEQCAAEGSNPGGLHVTIEDSGKTTFKPGEVISKETFDKENERVHKLGEKPATGSSGDKTWYLGEWWEKEYSTAECIVYRSTDGKKRLYAYWDGSKEVKPAP